MSYETDILKGSDETLPVTHRHDVYPTIDPKPFYAAQSYKGKVVLITGASRGIGQETALHYARAGASLAIVARSEESLNETKGTILAAVPSADVLVLTTDVRNVTGAEVAVHHVIEHFGRLDILIANAGFISLWASKDPNAWWNTFEVNIRGIFNFVSAAIRALEKVEGYIVAVSGIAAQVRLPGCSDGCISKHAVNRLVEFIALAKEAEAGDGPDTLALPAATMLYLTSGRADWLTGRHYSANWDISEVERDWKDVIVEKGGLVNKLYIPPRA
ncbi:NAD-P-binding protein [Multifurca ochricompacta]|uniref:NAD-P-binding protein n=1 Tax=Multifurca ochricompacta TaxID=376703 RepID=A0AAD4M079_9AGAM|nr:NAD-P-binding protein [Multifurca ochricompacta]